MVGEEGTILKHKVKAREKNRLTNKEPTLDTKSQCRIPIIWVETKQEKIINLLRKPSFNCIKSSLKLGRVTTVHVNSRSQTKHVITITCTQNKQTIQCLMGYPKNSRQNNN